MHAGHQREDALTRPSCLGCRPLALLPFVPPGLHANCTRQPAYVGTCGNTGGCEQRGEGGRRGRGPLDHQFAVWGRWKGRCGRRSVGHGGVCRCCDPAGRPCRRSRPQRPCLQALHSSLFRASSALKLPRRCSILWQLIVWVASQTLFSCALVDGACRAQQVGLDASATKLVRGLAQCICMMHLLCSRSAASGVVCQVSQAPDPPCEQCMHRTELGPGHQVMESCITGAEHSGWARIAAHTGHYGY